MIAIGNVKLGVRIEPIYLQELSKEEFDSIIKENNISLNENVNYPIDTRIINIFKTDKIKLQEYIKICKYAFEKRNSKDVRKINKEEISLFNSDLQINYELQDLKKVEMVEKFEKLKIYNNAKNTQNVFKAFGAKNVNIHMSLLDRAYFEIQKFLQNTQLKNQPLRLAEGQETSSLNKKLYDEESRRKVEEVSKNWKISEKKLKEDELTRN